jgi:hypothetical protein
MCILDIYTEVNESVNNMWPACAYQDNEAYPTTGSGDDDKVEALGWPNYYNIVKDSKAEGEGEGEEG